MVNEGRLGMDSLGDGKKLQQKRKLINRKRVLCDENCLPCRKIVNINIHLPESYN